MKIGRQYGREGMCVCGLQMEERLQQLVASRRANPSTAELEVRIGSWHDGHFTPGVPRTIFDQLEKDMVASSLTPTSKFPKSLRTTFTPLNAAKRCAPASASTHGAWS